MIKVTGIALLLVLSTLGVFAQEQPASGTVAAEATVTSEAVQPGPDEQPPPAERERPRSMYEVRNSFEQLLRNHPRELATILALDPALLSNRQFVDGYPALADFLAAHPEVPRNPRFYLVEFQERPRQRDPLDDIVEPIMIMGTIGLIAFALSWLLRTIIEQRRWSRLSRIQTEVHTKLLDRFGSSEELLAYMKTPAGSRFLESAPIPLHAGKPAELSSPLARVLWSVQIGVVIASAALATLLVSFFIGGEGSRGLAVIGAIALGIGAGFITSAVVSFILANRLGANFTGGDPVPPERKLFDQEAMR